MDFLSSVKVKHYRFNLTNRSTATDKLQCLSVCCPSIADNTSLSVKQLLTLLTEEAPICNKSRLKVINFDFHDKAESVRGKNQSVTIGGNYGI